MQEVLDELFKARFIALKLDNRRDWIVKNLLRSEAKAGVLDHCE